MELLQKDELFLFFTAACLSGLAKDVNIHGEMKVAEKAVTIAQLALIEIVRRGILNIPGVMPDTAHAVAPPSATGPIAPGKPLPSHPLSTSNRKTVAEMAPPAEPLVDTGGSIENAPEGT